MIDIDSQLLLNLAVTQLLQLTGLIVVVALVNRLMADRAPQAALALWLLVFVKAVTPPIWSADFGVFSWIQAPAVAVASADGPLLAVDWTRDAVSWRSATALLAIWVGGAAFCIGLAIVRKRQLTALLGRDEVANDHPLVQRARSLAERHGLRRPQGLVVSSVELGPAVAGVSRPLLILPESLVKTSEPEQLEPVILHELVHADRRDTRLAAALCFVRAVWWFNPLVWWATREADRLVERCVDVTIVKDLGSGLLDYARGLFRVLELRSTLQTRGDLASLRPCQITAERLTFLHRVSKDQEATPQRPRGGRFARRVVWVGLAAIVLPSLPVDSLQPTCLGPLRVCETTESLDQESAPSRPLERSQG